MTGGTRLQGDLHDASAHDRTLPLRAIRELPAKSWVYKLIQQMVSHVRVLSWIHQLGVNIIGPGMLRRLWALGPRFAAGRPIGPARLRLRY
jgi:hypothetical protein